MINIEFTDQEVQALARLLDAGVKHLGLSAAHAASAILVKLESAKPKEEEEK